MQQASAAAINDAMSQYLRSLGRASVMLPQDELRLAERYRAACLAVWQEAVTMPETMFRLLQSSGDAVPGVLSGLRTQIGRPRSKRALLLAAAMMRDADESRTWYQIIVGAARQYHTQGARAPLPTMVQDDPRYAHYAANITRAADAADALRNRFVEHNLRLVVSVARRYRNAGMAMIDLISEGNLGLVRAVERFLPERGFRFSTYATWWIRHAIGRAVADRGRSIRIPVHMLEAIHKLGGLERAYLREHGVAPEVPYLAKALAMSEDRTRELIAWRSEHAISIDTSQDEENDRTLGDLLCDEEADAAPHVALEQASTMRAVTTAMRALPPVEAAILRARFGVDDGHELTLQELGERHKLSRERIRQIQEQSIRKLRKILGNAV